MCHNAAVLENEQIEKCIENGMPHKIVKTVKYTMRQRATAASKSFFYDTQDEGVEMEQQLNETIPNQKTEDIVTTVTKEFQMKCPFSHGLLTAALRTDDPTVSPTYTNNYERLPSHSNSSDQLHSSSFEKESNINSGVKIVPTPPKDIQRGYNEDVLAKGTQLTRRLTFQMHQAIKCLQTTKAYAVVTKTTQPAHMIAICIVTLVLLTVWPEIIDGNPTKKNHILEKNSEEDPSANRKYILALMAYLGAFSTHFGAQIWMTFVSGLSLYFSLPRHMFGQCQQILFPKYFAMNGMLSIAMLIIFVKFFLNSWTLPQCLQLGALSVTGTIEVIVRLYLAPPLLRLMHEKYKIEGTIGSGKEVGSLVQGDLVQCPHYQRIHKAFRRTHMTVAIGNLITMAASCLHLYFIAGQIQISL